MPEFPPVALIYCGGPARAAIWVLVAGRPRLAHRPAWEVFVWSIGTALALPVFLPMYMLGARAPDRSAQWGPVEMIGIAIFFGLTMPLVAGLAGLRPGALTLRVVSVVILVQNAGFVLLSLLGIALRYRLPLARLGLTTRRWAAMLLVGLIAGAVMIPVASGTEQAGVEIYALLRGRQAAELQAERERKLDPLNRILATTKGPAATTWLIALLGMAVPIGEEVYFRGVVYGGLRYRYGPGGGGPACRSPSWVWPGPTRSFRQASACRKGPRPCRPLCPPSSRGSTAG